MPRETATGECGYRILFIAELARTARAGDRWLCAGRQSQLRTQRQRPGAGDREKQTSTGPGASPDAAKTPRSGGPANLRPTQSDRRASFRSLETTTRAAPVPATGAASSGNRVRAGGDWI